MDYCILTKLSNGLFFFEICSVITATECACKLNDAHFENLFTHTVAVMRLHISKKNKPLRIFNLHLQRIFFKQLLMPYRLCE